jgi:hypothetical protein
MLALVIRIYGVMNYLGASADARVRDPREHGSDSCRRASAGLGRAAVLIGVGTCVGLAGSVGLVRLIAKLLLGTAPLDPLTFAAAPALLAAPSESLDAQRPRLQAEKCESRGGHTASSPA